MSNPTDGTPDTPLTLKEEAIEVLQEWYGQLEANQNESPSELNGAVMHDVAVAISTVQAI